MLIRPDRATSPTTTTARSAPIPSTVSPRVHGPVDGLGGADLGDPALVVRNLFVGRHGCCVVGHRHRRLGVVVVVVDVVEVVVVTRGGGDGGSSRPTTIVTVCPGR